MNTKSKVLKILKTCGGEALTAEEIKNAIILDLDKEVKDALYELEAGTLIKKFGTNRFMYEARP